MKFVARLRPTPATVISLLALFASLGGVSYAVATGSIDSREIRNGTIRTKDLRNNEIRGLDIRNSTIQGRDVAVSSIGGEDIRESTLAQVPSAERADAAGAVDSLRAIGARTLAPGAPANILLTYGPLALTASCTAGGSGPVAQVRAQSTQAGSSADGEEASVPNLGGTPQAIAAVTSGGAKEVESSQIVVSGAGTAAVSGVVALVADPAGAGSCRFSGHAVVSGS
ncbi:MAG: hypothetical protein JW895_01710 [Thermoleophilaceae bacterium]|nr:hypothetical protein [Thermoleophilaceae bacterium]